MDNLWIKMRPITRWEKFLMLFVRSEWYGDEDSPHRVKIKKLRNKIYVLDERYQK